MSNITDHAIIDEYMVSLVTELHTNLAVIRDNVEKSLSKHRVLLFDALARESGEETLFYTYDEIIAKIKSRIIVHNINREKYTDIATKHINFKLDLKICRIPDNLFNINCMIMANLHNILHMDAIVFNNEYRFILEIAKLLNRLKSYGITPIDPSSHGIEISIKQTDKTYIRKMIKSIILNNGHLLTLYRPNFEDFSNDTLETMSGDMLCLNKSFIYSEEHFQKAIHKPIFAKFIIDTIINNNIISDQQLYTELDMTKTYSTYNYKMYVNINKEYVDKYALKNRKRKISAIESSDTE